MSELIVRFLSGKNVVMELYYVHLSLLLGGVCSLQGQSQLFLGNYWMEVLQINLGVVTTPF